MQTIGDRIKERREFLKLSQEELALRLGYKSKSSINKIELGVNKLTQSKILSIATALQTTPGYIMGWSAEPALYAGGDAPDEADEKYQEALAYVYQTIHDIRSREEADRLNRTVMLFRKLDDVDKERIIERMETMLEGEKYKK